MYAVFGASGRIGSAVARTLIERGEAVRVVLHRDRQLEPWTRLGAETATADIGASDQIAAALANASAAFVLNPPPTTLDAYVCAEDFGAAFARAIREAGVSKVVVLSSIGAHHPSGLGVISALNRFESALWDIAPATAILRSGYFIENWSEVAPAAISDGVLPSFLEPNRKLPMVSALDVGRTAARLLTESWKGMRIAELSGPQDWSASDVAAVFADVIDRRVVPAFIPPDQRAAILAEQGVPYAAATALLDMYVGIGTGRFNHDERAEELRGTTSLTSAVQRIVSTFDVAATSC